MLLYIDFCKILNPLPNKGPTGYGGQVEATTTLDGHTQCVGAVVWAESQTIHSASWDHSLRSWDVETSVNTTTLVPSLLPFL